MEISRRNSQSLFVAVGLKVRAKGNGCRICGVSCLDVLLRCWKKLCFVPWNNRLLVFLT